MNYHAVDSKQWSLYTKHLTTEFTVERHCGSQQRKRSTCNVKKKKKTNKPNQESLKKKIFIKQRHTS